MEPIMSTLPVWLQFLGPILVALLTSTAGWIGLRKQLQKDTTAIKKDEADAAQAIQEAAIALLSPYQYRVEILTEKVDSLSCDIRDITKERNKLKKRVQVLEKGIDILITQLQEAGIDPVWTRNGRQ